MFRTHNPLVYIVLALVVGAIVLWILGLAP